MRGKIGMEFMTIDIEQKNGVSVAALKGRLDVITASELDKAFNEIVEGGARKVLFDYEQIINCR
ncbi:MAG: hypothetical protein IKO42_06860 [Opitutales bacterium]|nr:hypothetical protein [Opitutales bacterium]